MPTPCTMTGCSADALYRFYQEGEKEGPATCAEHLGPLVAATEAGSVTVLAMCHTLGACPEEGETSIGCCPEAWPGVNEANVCELAAECQARMTAAVPAEQLAAAVKCAEKTRAIFPAAAR